MTAALYGLVLTGGRSRRMQTDKAALEYAGQPQLTRALALLDPLVVSNFVSVRADQLHDPQRSGHPCIVDQLADAGPIGGILAALRAHPHAAWLVLACDLPFLDAATLQQLIAARDPRRLATAFRSSHDDRPEPLCAIYEPASLSAMEAWVASGQQCPRGFLAQAEVALLRLRTPRALDNINTAAEYSAAHDLLRGDGQERGAPRAVQVQYFALLREQAGRSAETVRTRAHDARQLYEELRITRALKLRPEQLRVAINEEFADWSQTLADGDSVVFLPPVAGG
jgi:molybdopterin-guanine dinucleotide biosynthesis protein A/molybdopterin converting factor small subunit